MQPANAAPSGVIDEPNSAASHPGADDRSAASQQAAYAYPTWWEAHGCPAAVAPDALERLDQQRVQLHELLDLNTRLTEEVNRLTFEIHRALTPNQRGSCSRPNDATFRSMDPLVMTGEIPVALQNTKRSAPPARHSSTACLSLQRVVPPIKGRTDS
jgi:hypothetical protein